MDICSNVPIVEISPDLEPLEVLDLPDEGVIGAGVVERRFCRCAREVTRLGIAPDDIHYIGFISCDALAGGYCGLTRHNALCLFCDTKHPQWEQIRADIAFEQSAPPAPFCPPDPTSR